MFFAPTRPVRQRRRGVLLAALCAGLTSTPAGAAELLQLQVGKAEQRWLGIRTLTAEAAQRGLSLHGRVIVDPRQQHRVTAGEVGLIEAPEPGFPASGAIVEAGTVLAWLKPSIAEPARRDLLAELASARKAVALGKLQIKRFSIDESQAVEGNLLTPSIRITSDYRSALARVAHLERTLEARAAIRAPATGRLLYSAVNDGRIARAGETLFEIDGSAQTVIEAPVPAALRRKVSEPAHLHGDDSRNLLNIGERFDTASRSWLARFSLPAGNLLPGQTVVVEIAAASDAPLSVPADSLFERDQRHWVWLHKAPEQFVAEAVEVVARDGGRIDIRSVALNDQRIVVSGGPALSARLPKPEPRT